MAAIYFLEKTQFLCAIFEGNVFVKTIDLNLPITGVFVNESPDPQQFERVRGYRPKANSALLKSGVSIQVNSQTMRDFCRKPVPKNWVGAIGR